MRFSLLIFFLFFSIRIIAQNTNQNNNKATILGKIKTKNQQKILEGIVALKNTSFQTNANENGNFTLKNIPYGTYIIVAFCLEKQTQEKNIIINSPTFSIDFLLEDFASDLEEVTVQAERERTFGITRLRSVENFGIYEGKKNEVIVLKDMNLNLATNNARQVYAKITGLNIWESDGGAGLQLGIGGRGLSPDRTTNFNTRQNGYDISADALGYPEAYYTPPAEGLERIEIVRGAASLQYGTQFGGMVNFLMKKGENNQNNQNGNNQNNNQITALTRLSAGSWGFLSSFNSISGQAGKLNFYAYFQHKQGNGFRENSGFKSNNAFISLNYQVSTKFLVNVDITKMQYLAQQAGGLTDKMFQENVRQSVRNRNFFEVDWNLFSVNFTYKFSEKTQVNIRNFALSAGRQSVGNLERINVADLGGERTLVAGKFQNLGNEIRLLHRYQLGFGKNISNISAKKTHTLLIGTRIYKGTTSAKQGNGTNGNDANFTYLNPTNLENSDYDFPNQNYAVFAENIFNISDKFSLTPGARFENIQTFSNGYYKQRVLDGAGNVIIENKIQENQERKRNFVLFGLGASYKVNDKIEFYSNISQNYRAINFSDLRIVNPNFFIDPNIQDEKGFTADMGVRGSLEDFFTFESTLFLLSYQGKIGQILKADQPPLFNDYRLRTNVADARNIGLELFGEVSLLKLFNRNNQQKNKENISEKPSENNKKSAFQWTIFTNLSLISAQYINTQETSIKNKKVEMVPPITLKTGTTFKYKKFATTLQFAYIGEHFSDATNAKRTSTAVEGIIPAYKIMDLSMNYEWKTLKLEASINNILNEKYFTRRAEFYPGPGIIPADGRGFYMTLQMKIQ